MRCQTESEFAKAYASGVNKREYWKSTYEDVRVGVRVCGNFSSVLHHSLARCDDRVQICTSPNGNEIGAEHLVASVVRVSRPFTEVLNLIAKLPEIAAIVRKCKYRVLVIRVYLYEQLCHWGGEFVAPRSTGTRTRTAW